MEVSYRFLFSDLFTILAGFLVCIIGVDSKKDQEIKMNGRPAKPKATKVTFEDEVIQTTIETSEPSEAPPADEIPEYSSDEEVNHIGEHSSDSEPDSESDQSSEEDDDQEGRPVDDSLVLTPEMADLMLSHLDLMNLRTLKAECTSAHLLKKHIAGAQARLDQAKNMLDNIPDTMSDTERKVYMLEISQYVESIFASLERLSIKLVKCHGDAVCDIIQEFDDNVKTIEAQVPKPPKTARKRVKADKEKALRIFEVSVLFAFLVLSAFTAYVLTQPDIGTAFGGFILNALNTTWIPIDKNSVLNGTWNVTDKNPLPICEGNCSIMDALV